MATDFVTRTRGGIGGVKPSPDEVPGSDWRQISALAESYVESIKEEMISKLDDIFVKRNINRRVERSTMQLVKPPQTIRTPGARLKARKLRSRSKSPALEQLTVGVADVEPAPPVSPPPLPLVSPSPPTSPSPPPPMSPSAPSPSQPTSPLPTSPSVPPPQDSPPRPLLVTPKSPAHPHNLQSSSPSPSDTRLNTVGRKRSSLDPLPVQEADDEGCLSKPAKKPFNLLQQHSFLPARNSPLRATEARQKREQYLKDKIAEKARKEEARKKQLDEKKEQEKQDRIKKREDKLKRVAENQALIKKREQEKNKERRKKREKAECEKEKLKQKKTIRVKEDVGMKEEKHPGPSVKAPDPSVKPPVPSVKPPGPSVKPHPVPLFKPPAPLIKPAAPPVKPSASLIKPPAPLIKPPAPPIKPSESIKPKPANVSNMLKEWALKLHVDKTGPVEHITTPVTSAAAMLATSPPSPIISISGTPDATTSSNTPDATTSNNTPDAITSITSSNTPDAITSITNTAPSTLNCTYVVEPSEVVSEPAMTTPTVQRAHPVSYEITPADKDPLVVSDNYDIHNLNSEDESEDEDCPSKPVPQWAAHGNIKVVMKEQEYFVGQGLVDVEKIFPPDQLLLEPDLAKIFGHSKRRYFKRTSSACWNSPMLKKSKKIKT